MWGVTDFFFTLLVFWFSKMYYVELFMLRNRTQEALLPTFTCFIPPSCPHAVVAPVVEPLLRMCASLLGRESQCSLTCCLQESIVVLLNSQLCRLSFLPAGVLSSDQEPAFGVFFKGNNNYKSSKLCLMWMSPFVFLSSLAMVVRIY